MAQLALGEGDGEGEGGGQVLLPLQDLQPAGSSHS